MIFSMNITKESEEYLQAMAVVIGKSPFTNKEVELIKNTSYLKDKGIKYKTVHENNYYKELEDTEGKTYLMKFSPSREDPPEVRFSNNIIKDTANTANITIRHKPIILRSRSSFSSGVILQSKL